MKSTCFATPLLVLFYIWWFPWTSVQFERDTLPKGHTLTDSKLNFDGSQNKLTEEEESKNLERLLVPIRTISSLATENQSLDEEKAEVVNVETTSSNETLDETLDETLEEDMENIVWQNNKLVIEEKANQNPSEVVTLKDEQVEKEEKITVSVARCSHNDVKFFNNEGKKRPRVGLISYPRSGNSMTRVLIERLTGIFTGSYPTSVPLIPFGFLGEGYIDDSVSAIKYHGHQNITGIERLKFDKLIYLVRNPFDSFLSRLHKVRTNSHNKTIEYIPNVFLKNRVRHWLPEWQTHVQRIALAKDSKYLVSDGRALPVLLVRYEDIVSNATICFTFQNKSLCSSSKAHQLSRIYDFLELPTSTTESPSASSSSPPSSSPPVDSSENFFGFNSKVFPSNTSNETLRSLQEGNPGKVRRTVPKDFSSHPFPLTVDRLHCVTVPEPSAGYTPRKKTNSYAVDLYPAEVRESMMKELKNELCALGYACLSPTFQITCDEQVKARFEIFSLCGV